MFQKITLTSFLLLFSLSGNAQFTSFLPQQGVLPFSGAKFYNHGIGGEEIKISLAEDTWTSNRLPISTEFEVKLLRPSGLKMQEDGNYYPGIEVLILNSKKDTLGFAPNIFGEESEGLDASMLKSLTLSLGFSEQSKPGDSIQILAKFFDTRSTAYLLIDFPVIVVEPTLPLNVTNFTYSVKKTDTYHGISTGVELSKADVKLVENSKSPLLEISLLEMAGITQQEFEKGKSTVWKLDGNLNGKTIGYQNVSVKMKEKKMDLVIKIPITENDKQVRFRWESSDGLKILDFIGQI